MGPIASNDRPSGYVAVSLAGRIPLLGYDWPDIHGAPTPALDGRRLLAREEIPPEYWSTIERTEGTAWVFVQEFREQDPSAPDATPAPPGFEWAGYDAGEYVWAATGYSIIHCEMKSHDRLSRFVPLLNSSSLFDTWTDARTVLSARERALLDGDTTLEPHFDAGRPAIYRLARQISRAADIG